MWMIKMNINEYERGIGKQENKCFMAYLKNEVGCKKNKEHVKHRGERGRDLEKVREKVRGNDRIVEREVKRVEQG